MEIPLQILEARLAHAVAAVRHLLASEAPSAATPAALAGLAAELRRVLRAFDPVAAAPHNAAEAAPAPAPVDADLARVWQQAVTLGALLAVWHRRSGAAQPVDLSAAIRHLALVCGRAPTAATARPILWPVTGQPHLLAAALGADEARHLPDACFMALAHAAVSLKHAGFDR